MVRMVQEMRLTPRPTNGETAVQADRRSSTFPPQTYSRNESGKTHTHRRDGERKRAARNCTDVHAIHNRQSRGDSVRETQVSLQVLDREKLSSYLPQTKVLRHKQTRERKTRFSTKSRRTTSRSINCCDIYRRQSFNFLRESTTVQDL